MRYSRFNGPRTINLNTASDDVWFTSDTHFGHRNMIQALSRWKAGAVRPQQTVEEMNEHLIETINAHVSEDSILFHLGDFVYPDNSDTIRFRKAIKCKTVCLILGNHDPYIRKHANHFIGEGPGQFQTIRDLSRIRVNDQQIILCHYPLLSWEGHHHGYWHLHGHCHGSLVNNMPEYYKRKVMDVGWDVLPKPGPLSFTQIKEIMDTKDIVTIDHHVENRYTPTD